MPWSETSAESNDGSHTAQGDGEGQRFFQCWGLEKSQVLENPATIFRGPHNGATSDETLPDYGTAHPTRLGLWLDRYSIQGKTASTFIATALYSNDGRFGSLDRTTQQQLKEVRLRTSNEIREDAIPDASLLERTIGTVTGVERRNLWIRGEFIARVRVHKILLSILLPSEDVSSAQRAFVRNQTDNLHFFSDTTDPPAWHLFTGAVFSDQGKTWRIVYEWINDPGIPAIPRSQVFATGGSDRYSYPFEGESTLPDAVKTKLWTRPPFHIVRYFSRNHIKQPNGDAFWPAYPVLQRHETAKDEWKQFPGIVG